MSTDLSLRIIDGSQCKVIAGTHAQKSGVVRDLHMSKTGHLTITVVQENCVRFKTLAKNVVPIVEENDLN